MDWKIILGKEKRKVKAFGSSVKDREVEFYQIVSHDGQTFTIGDYTVIGIGDIQRTKSGEVPESILLIDNVYYEPRGSQKYASNFRIRSWHNYKILLDIFGIKFKKLNVFQKISCLYDFLIWKFTK
jgi:hypothetical protein